MGRAPSLHYSPSGDHFSPRPTLSTTQSSTPSATPSTRLLWRRNCHACLARVKSNILTTLQLILPRVTSQRKVKVPRFLKFISWFPLLYNFHWLYFFMTTL